MQEIIFIVTILCFVNEGVPYAPHRDEGEHRPRKEEVQTILVDMGSNLTLPCGSSHDFGMGAVMWIRNGRSLSIARNQVREDGSLFFPNLTQSDSGLYTCRSDTIYDDNENAHDSSSSEQIETPFRIRVRTPPRSLNVSVTPSTIYAQIMWDVGEDGGYPISSFQIRYRLQNTSDDWKTCQPNFILPNRRQFQLYHLQPNSLYAIEIWANNKLGKGVTTILDILTHNDMQEIEFEKVFDTFDTRARAWIIAVAVVMGTLCLLGVATCCLFYREYKVTWSDSRDHHDMESIELMPNIILNPSYDYDFQSMEYSHPDENSNDTTAMRVNNNSVIFPARV